jgi:hypothetical protein
MQRRRRSAAQGRTIRDLGAGATPSLRTSGRSAPGAWTVRDGVDNSLLRSRPRSRLPEDTQSGGKILGCIILTSADHASRL